MLDPKTFWCINRPIWPEWFRWEPPPMLVVWSGLSYSLPMITQQLLSTRASVDIVLERISYAFYSSRSEVDPLWVTQGAHSMVPPSPPHPVSLPHSLLSSFLLASCAYTLHAVDFLPCSHKSWVSGEPVWSEVSVQSFWTLVLSTRLSTPHPPLPCRQPPPGLFTGLGPSPHRH